MRLVHSHHPTSESKALPGQPLTPRQREIALMICEEGISSKDIARRLDITEAVVKSHLTRIYIKLGIHKRAQIHIAMGK